MASRSAPPFLVSPCLPGVLTPQKSPLCILYRLSTPGIFTSWTVRRIVTIWRVLGRCCGVVGGSYRLSARPVASVHGRDRGRGLGGACGCAVAARALFQN